MPMKLCNVIDEFTVWLRGQRLGQCWSEFVGIVNPRRCQEHVKL
jgi:hypothetical protein